MITILGMLGALQGLILAGAVFSLGDSSRGPNRDLGWILLVLSAAVFTIAGQHGGLFGNSIFPVLVEYVAALLLPPTVWKYATTVLGTRPRVPIWVHFMPVVTFVAYLLSFTLGLTSWRWLPPILLVISYQVVYTLAVAVRTWSSGSRQKALVSHHRVLRASVAVLFIVHLAQIVRFLFQDVSMLSDIVPLTSTATICILSVLAFRQSRLFVGHEPEPTTKYASSTLSAERAEEIQAQLLRVLEQDKPFLNENLTLADLAARLKVSRSHLSQVVNEGLGCSFSELLVQQRLRAARVLLSDPAQQHLTIEDIGYSVGFRSRSAFHNAWKRSEGETPGQSRRRFVAEDV